MHRQAAGLLALGSLAIWLGDGARCLWSAHHIGAALLVDTVTSPSAAQCASCVDAVLVDGKRVMCTAFASEPCWDVHLLLAKRPSGETCTLEVAREVTADRTLTVPMVHRSEAIAVEWCAATPNVCFLRSHNAGLTFIGTVATLAGVALLCVVFAAKYVTQNTHAA